MRRFVLFSIRSGDGDISFFTHRHCVILTFMATRTLPCWNIIVDQVEDENEVLLTLNIVKRSFLNWNLWRTGMSLHSELAVDTTKGRIWSQPRPNTTWLNGLTQFVSYLACKTTAVIFARAATHHYYYNSTVIFTLLIESVLVLSRLTKNWTETTVFRKTETRHRLDFSKTDHK